MLTELHIENLGVIERLEVILGDGLTVVTGETGAGKTMLVEAIELLVGGRADTTVVRHGTDEARVDGRFITADGGELVLEPRHRPQRPVAGLPRTAGWRRWRRSPRRPPGSSTSTVSTPTRACSRPPRNAPRSTGSATSTSNRCARRGHGSPRSMPNWRRSAATSASRAREIDLLRYQLEELDAADVIDADEDARLDAEETLLGDAVGFREVRRAGRGRAAPTTAGPATRLADRARCARRPRRRTTGRSNGCTRVLSEIDDVVAEVRQTAESIDESPDRLEAIRERRQLLKNLCRKYGDDLAAVMEFHAETQAAPRRARTVRRQGGRARRATGSRRSPTKRRRRRLVGAARRAAAPKLAAAVQSALRELALPHAEIAVQVGEHDDDDPGDHVTFLLAANPGSPLLPLTRVASGGELARTMLALRLTLGRRERRPGLTLVFDEVDAGIGGTAASAVGRRAGPARRRRAGAGRDPPGAGRGPRVDPVRRRQDGRKGTDDVSATRRRGRRAGRRDRPDAVGQRLGVGPAARTGAVA